MGKLLIFNYSLALVIHGGSIPGTPADTDMSIHTCRFGPPHPSELDWSTPTVGSGGFSEGQEGLSRVSEYLIRHKNIITPGFHQETVRCVCCFPKVGILRSGEPLVAAPPSSHPLHGTKAHLQSRLEDSGWARVCRFRTHRF